MNNDDDDLTSAFRLTQSVTKTDNRRSAVAVRQTETAFEKDHLGPYPWGFTAARQARTKGSMQDC